MADAVRGNRRWSEDPSVVDAPGRDQSASGAPGSPHQSDDVSDGGPQQPGGQFGRLMRRSVRARLGALIALPLLAASLLGVLVFGDARANAAAAQRAEDMARIAAAAVDLSWEVQNERDLRGLLLADGTDKASVDKAVERTNAAAAEFDAAIESADMSELPSSTQRSILEAKRRVDQLDFYRRSAVAGLEYDKVVLQDGDKVVDAAIALMSLPGSGARDSELIGDAQMLDLLARTAQAASYERGYLAWALRTGQPLTPADQAALGSARRTEATLYDRAEAGLPHDLSLAMRTGIEQTRDPVNNVREATEGNQAPGVAPLAWYDASTERLNVFHEVETRLADSLVSRASSIATQARTTAIVTLAALALAMLGTFAIVALVARSIIRPLRRLRSAALEAADHGLPSLVERIREEGPRAVSEANAPIEAESSDEIGQVTDAFNAVHATAVRVAGEQAMLRQNLDSIVVNLSRRTQSLVDRQLREIEDLEARERDPDQLGTLFRIDHLSTRVRRHAESLLVLAGVEAMRRAPEPVPILDVVRAAVGEVEQYPRVRFGVLPTDLVAASAVDDVAHLLAELIDNATEFSPPSTAVTVSTQPLRAGGLRVSVSDDGLGIPAGELAELNARLNSPGDIDVAASRTLGLYVVARLASRHGVRVRLVTRPEGGTTAEVDLPQGLIVSPLDVESMGGPVRPGVPVLSEAAGSDDGPGATVHPHPALTRNRPAPERPDTPSRPSGPPRRPQPVGSDHGGLPRRSPDPGGLPRRAPDQGGLPRRVPGQGGDAPVPPLLGATQPPRPVDTPPGPLPRRGEPSPGGEFPQRQSPDGRQSGPRTGPAPGALPRRGEQPASGLPQRGEQPPGDLPRRGQTPPGGLPQREPGTAAHPRLGNRPTAGLPRRGDQVSRAPERPDTPEQPGGPLQRRTPQRPAPGARPLPGAGPAAGGPQLQRPAEDEELPIFNAVRSAWFKRGGAAGSWTSPADEGWRRADAAARAAEAASLAASFAARELRVGATTPDDSDAPTPEPRQPAAGGPTLPTRGQPQPSAPTLPTRGRPQPAAPSRTEPWTRGGQPGPLGGDRPAAIPGAPTAAPRPGAARPATQPSTPHAPAARTAPEAPAARATPPDAATGLPQRPAPGAEGRPKGPGGLPTRQRGATLVPGAISPTRGDEAGRDAKTVRSTLSTLQRGVSRGRDAARKGDTGGWIPTRPDRDERSNS